MITRRGMPFNPSPFAEETPYEKADRPGKDKEDCHCKRDEQDEKRR
jgi:hypothetical protein